MAMISHPERTERLQPCQGRAEGVRILCVNHEGQRTFIRIFIHAGFKRIVLRSWSARPICPWKPCGQSCSVGPSHTRQTQTRGTTFGLFRCFFGTDDGVEDQEYTKPTLHAIAWHGFNKSQLPNRTAGSNREIVSITIEKTNQFKVKKSRAGLPFATVRVLHVHPPLSYGAVEEDLRKHVLRFVMEFRPGAIAGDGNKSVNASSKFPDHGLFNRPRRARGTHSKPWNPLTVWASPRTHLRFCDTDLLNKCFCNCTACVEIANLGLRAKVVPSRT